MNIDLPSPFQGGGGPGALQQAMSRPKHNNIQFGTGIDLYKNPLMANPSFYQSPLMKGLIQQQAMAQQQQQMGMAPPNMSGRGIVGPMANQNIPPMQPPIPPALPMQAPLPGRSVEVPDLSMAAQPTLDNNSMRSAVLGGVSQQEVRNPKTLEYLKKYGVSTNPIPNDIKSKNDPKEYNKIALDAAIDAGIPTSYLPKVLGIESGGNPNAVSPTGAKGLYQFTKSTWNHINKKYDLGLTNPFDPIQNTKAAAYLAKENAKALQSANLPVNDTNLYITHNIGAGGAKKLLNADPGAKVNEVLDMVLIKNNPMFFKAKGGGWNTVGDALSKYKQYIGD